MRIDLRWNIVSVAFFFSTNKVGWWEWALYPHHFQLSFLAVRLWASHSTSLGVEKIYLWKIRELEWMTSKIPSSSTGSQGQVLILTGANALEAFISLILQPSAHLSTGEWMRSTKPSELNQVKEDMALVCWEPTFWFMRQEIHRGQNQKTGQDILWLGARKGILAGGSHSHCWHSGEATGCVVVCSKPSVFSNS